ncbi:hypothetical protein FRC07_005711 [Ceratobasidium sp. 392]|nr:hypothetical protein FRC07_005711 [Ceratobasidium sp. 392]
MKSDLLNSLGTTAELYYKSKGDQKDPAQSIAYHQQAAQSPVGPPSMRLSVACSWARLASSSPGLSSLQSYSAIVALLPDVFWIGSPEMECYGSKFNLEDITAEVLTGAIAAQSYDLALEWFKECRMCAWKETLRLKSTQLTNLRLVEPGLASGLEQVALELNTSNGRRDECAQQRWRCLAVRWRMLIAQVRNVPGFKGFLQPKKTKLTKAARSGPVVVVNVHKSRCDALVIRPGEDVVSHVPLPGLSAHNVISARSRLGKITDSREPRECTGHSNVLRDMLGMLWDDIVKPVLGHLRHINASSRADIPHITWCTTGPISGLPLHAAGRYEEPRTGIYDYAISSYSPSLSALIARPPHPTDLNGMLIVSPTATTGRDVLTGVADELNRVKNRAIGLPLIELAGDEATVQNVLSEMEKYDWVHLACTVSQNSHYPNRSVIHLHDGDLALEAIMSKSGNSGGIVYLSRSQAIKHHENVLDEAFPVAAGMLMAGRSTVVTTIWPAQEQDIATVAERMYAYLKDEGFSIGANVARALHISIERLRTDAGDDFMRWVPFVRIGL